MRWFFKLIFQLVAAAVFIFLCTAVWIVFDGLTDLGEKADVALVTGRAPVVPGKPNALLDRVVQLYNEEEFPYIILSGSNSGAHDEPAAMADYLEHHGIPANMIIKGHRVENTSQTAQDAAEIMKSHQFESVMVVSNYYHITRTKLALTHEGIVNIQKAHIGILRKEDAWSIGHEVVALYAYLGNVYLFPAAQKVQEEAKVGMKSASVDAEKAKEKVDKSLDNLSK